MRTLTDDEVLQLATRIWPGSRGFGLAPFQQAVLAAVVAYVDDILNNAPATASPPPPPSTSLPENIDSVLVDALSGKNGAGQKIIAQQALAWTVQLLKKNADYGSAVFSPPMLVPWLSARTVILSRMSDKVARIASLVKQDKAPRVVSESLEDSIADLGAYCLLWLCEPSIESA